MAGPVFTDHDADAPIAEINTTPLVDVMLVLLVIFLVTAPMMTQAIKLDLPKEAATDVKDEKPATLSIDAAGAYFWNNESVSEAELAARMATLGKSGNKAPLHLRADVAASYGAVSKALGLAQKHNVSNIGFITQPQ